MQALCQIYAAVSYICIGDSESSTQVKFSGYCKHVSFVYYCNLVFFIFLLFVLVLFLITEMKFGCRHLT